jgi:hypothetical protein
MSDFFQKTTVNGELSFLNTTPFACQVSINRKEDGEIQGINFNFNQAYIVDYLDAAKNHIKIANMEQGIGEDELDTIIHWYVEVNIDPDSGAVLSAYLNKAKGEEWSGLPSDHPKIAVEDQTNPTVQIIKVASSFNGMLQEVKLRDNIHWWGRSIIQKQVENQYVGHPVISISGVAKSRPIEFRSISGNGQPDYKIVDVFDSSGEATIIVSGITGYGVMYGDGPAGQETYKFLPYPDEIAQSAGGYYDSWEWRLIAGGDPPILPTWSEKQYLPQVAEGAAQGDILYYDETEGNG